MIKILNNFFQNVKIYVYNARNYNDNCKTDREKQTNKNNSKIDDKQLRIDTLLFIKQIKNTYYKYANKEKYNQELYNSFINENYFDGGTSGYDDDDNIRIFDRYILEYIKNRNDLMTYIVCKNKNIIPKIRLNDLNDVYNNKENNIDILFIIDMNEKDIFNYCYDIIYNTHDISSIKNIMFSFVCKYRDEYIRIQSKSITNCNTNHPYLLLERLIA
jgi:hypothetical protein